MANDRIYIKCDTCNRHVMFLKFSPGLLYFRNSGLLLDWIEKHGECHPSIYENSLGSTVGFSLYTEESIEAGSIIDILEKRPITKFTSFFRFIRIKCCFNRVMCYINK